MRSSRCPKRQSSHRFTLHDSLTCRHLHKSRSSRDNARSGTTPRNHEVDHAADSRRPANARPSRESQLAHRDFFFDILSVNATRRDAKQYLARFKEKPQQASIASQVSKSDSNAAQTTKPSPSVGRARLQSLYGSTKAIRDSPTFRDPIDEVVNTAKIPKKHLHVALVGIRAADKIDDASLDGIAITLSQLVRLDMRIIIALDISSQYTSIRDYRSAIQVQAQRLTRAIDLHHGAGARYVDSSLRTVESGDTPRDNPGVSIESPNLILRPLRQTMILIVPCLAFDRSCKATRIQHSSLITALAAAACDEHDSAMQVDTSLAGVSLDRIILIDPNGGIPSTQREDRAHVFVNMAEEFSDIVQELEKGAIDYHGTAPDHLINLKSLNTCLGMLPSTTSALIVSHEEAASSSKPIPEDSNTEVSAIRTRRQKNPLIHNLLTNRPLVSSSLPEERMYSDPTGASSRSTLLKWGMPLCVVPSVKAGPWAAPVQGSTRIDLRDDSEIDFPRLQHLVEDSFRRPLDVEAYLKRVDTHIAGVLVAGDYEGGAILTWEVPPGTEAEPSRVVPYLDKFAVLQKSQGNAGVADIVFQAMTRSCLPHGVCWRSRSNNPVNKWYFERSVGSWKLPGGQWTMFWTTPSDDLVLDKQRWHDYVAVCQSVVPTWADSKRAQPD